MRTWKKSLKFSDGSLHEIEFSTCSQKQVNDRKKQMGYFAEQYLAGAIAMLKESGDTASINIAKELINEQAKKINEHAAEYDILVMKDHVNSDNGIKTTNEYFENLDPNDFSMLFEEVKGIELDFDNKFLVLKHNLIRLLDSFGLEKDRLNEVNTMFNEAMNGELEKKT